MDDILTKLYDHDNRLDKLENEVTYKDVCVYVCIVYIIYVCIIELNIIY